MKKLWLFVALGSLLSVAVLASCIAPNPAASPKPVAGEVELKYDNNSLKEYLSLSPPSYTGYLIGFVSPSNTFTIHKIRINATVWASSGYEDKNVEVQVWDNDSKVLATVDCPIIKFPINPYQGKTAFHPENNWIDVDIPDVSVAGHFFIQVYPDSGRWGDFQMGADDSVVNSHSNLTVRDGDVDIVLTNWPYWKIDSAGHDLWYGDKTRVNWMIRVVGTPSTT